jgi:hypothetical protein
LYKEIAHNEFKGDWGTGDVQKEVREARRQLVEAAMRDKKNKA